MCEQGIIIGSPITQCRFVIEDGMAHTVDSSELAFRSATHMAMIEAYQKANPIVLEPIMQVHLSCPSEYQVILLSLTERC